MKQRGFILKKHIQNLILINLNAATLKSFTARYPMRLMAMLVIASLISATMLYFYDILVDGLRRLTWHNHPLFSKHFSQYAALIMASTIGLGVLIESAITIWDRLEYWAQILDNKFTRFFYGKTYFIDDAYELLLKTRQLFNRTNLLLQAIAIPTDSHTCTTKEDIKKISNKIKNIKNNCQKVNVLLENNQTRNRIHRARQEEFKQLLNNLVSGNLEMSSWVESIAAKMDHPAPSPVKEDIYSPAK